MIDLPTFLSKPDCVVGIPVWRAIRCLKLEIPIALFHEKENPYLDIMLIYIRVIIISSNKFKVFKFNDKQ